jgi:hypothetical protein
LSIMPQQILNFGTNWRAAGSGSALPMWIQIWIQETNIMRIDLNPDPKHWQ